MNNYQVIGAVLAVVFYIPLVIQVWVGKVKQNLTTWMLFTILDLIATLAILMQDGEWYLPFAFTLGCAVVTSVLIMKSDGISFTRFDYVVTAFVAVCMVGWYFSGPYLATILSVIGIAIAGIPQIKDACRWPERMPIGIYFGHMISSILSTVGAGEWTLEDKLFPAYSVIFCGMLVIISSRRFFAWKPHSA